MRALLANLVLAVAWAALSGALTTPRLAFGFLLAFLVLALGPTKEGTLSYRAKTFRLLKLLAVFLAELVVATFNVALAIVRPLRNLRVRVFALPLDAKTDLEITLVANLITLTPGTLSLDVSEDRSALLIHAIGVEDVDAVRAHLKSRFERPLLEILR